MVKKEVKRVDMPALNEKNYCPTWLTLPTIHMEKYFVVISITLWVMAIFLTKVVFIKKKKKRRRRKKEKKKKPVHESWVRWSSSNIGNCLTHSFVWWNVEIGDYPHEE